MKPKIALVHHWLVSPGGAERLLYELHQMYPDSPIYTAAYTPEKFPELVDADVRTTWLNRIPLAKTKHQFFPVLRGLAFRMLNLSEYDIVISSCAAEAKYVTTGKHTLHICYCHTPVRYYWSDYDWYVAHPPFGKLNWLVQGLLPLMIGWLRRIDFAAAQRVNVFIANSTTVKARIKKYYKRDSTVIFPPIVTDPLLKLERNPQDFYLIVGRQVAYKRLDLAVDAFNKLGYKLKVVGQGEEIAKQRGRAKSNIEFLGWVDDAERNQLFATAKAFIWPQEEDFGMTPLEAMAAGCPVVAYGVGGAADYMIDGRTGVVFAEQTVPALAKAIERSQSIQFDEAQIRQQARAFDKMVFRKQIAAFVDEHWKEFQGKRA